jgi:phosphatidylinositol alpha-1,6-mannosyltransferase
VLSVARLVPRKGIDQVLRALRYLPDVEYRVIGHGPDEARLRSLAESLGVSDRVRFLGRVSDSQLAREYAEASLLVLPARRTADGQLEGYGLVYFEAAAWGRPSVAGRSGGEVDAVVDGQTGLLVDGASHEQVAAAVASLLDDPARLRSMGAAARARVESSHNWQNAAASVDAILASLA